MKKTKRLLLGPFATVEEKHYHARLLDKLDLAEKTGKVQVTDFIDPRLQEISNRLLKGYLNMQGLFEGGCENSERKRLMICPEFIDQVSSIEYVVLLYCEGDCPLKEYISARITHRDFLGAVLGTGIKREKIGDIWPLEKGCVLAVAREIKEFFYQQPLTVKGISLTVREMELRSFNIEDKTGKMIETTVSSLRLDAVAAAGFATSRSKLMREILAGRFKVNWQETSRLDHQMNEGDVISCRGRGRVIIDSISGQTRKGRMKVCLKRLN